MESCFSLQKNRYFIDYIILDIYFIYILSTRHSISKTEISREFDIMRLFKNLVS